MAAGQQMGFNAHIAITDDTAACRDISGDTNSVTISWTRDNPESTTFGNSTRQRLPGMRDFAVSGTSVWDTTASTGIDKIMRDIMAASVNTCVFVAPGGSTAGCPSYTACMTLSQWEISIPVDGVVTAAWAFDHSSGSVTIADIS